MRMENIEQKWLSLYIKTTKIHFQCFDSILLGIFFFENVLMWLFPFIFFFHLSRADKKTKSFGIYASQYNTRKGEKKAHNITIILSSVLEFDDIIFMILYERKHCLQTMLNKQESFETNTIDELYHILIELWCIWNGLCLLLKCENDVEWKWKNRRE